MASRADKQYLEKHGNQWRVQVGVPKAAQEILGRKRLVKGLGTDSLALANLKKWPIVEQFQREIERALRQAERDQRGGKDPLLEEAATWRNAIDDEEANAETNGTLDEEGRFDPVVPDLLRERAEELAPLEGDDRAAFFYRVALGQATPIAPLIDTWLAERPNMKQRQLMDYRRAAVKFVDWLSEEGLDASLEGSTRKLAGRYISETMVAKGVHWKTANKSISALSSYWKWLLKKGHATENIWQGQSLEKVRVTDPDQKSKRAFTDQEVRALFDGVTDDLLLDAMSIAALSGMRVNELATLQVRDCTDGQMYIRASKTAAGVRRVPIHSNLKELIKQRCKGKQPNDFLFHELPHNREEPEQIISKRFTRARRKLGVDDVLPGQRQSRIDFHSFRRWFAGKARDALQAGAKGFDPYTIAEVIGHDRENAAMGLAMTMGRYAGADSLAAKRACVEAVRLPKQP